MLRLLVVLVLVVVRRRHVSYGGWSARGRVAARAPGPRGARAPGARRRTSSRRRTTAVDDVAASPAGTEPRNGCRHSRVGSCSCSWLSPPGSSGPHQNGEKWLRQVFDRRAVGWSAHKRSQREEAVRGPGDRSSARSRGGARTSRSPGANEPRSRHLVLDLVAGPRGYGRRMSEITNGGRPCAWCGEPVRQQGLGRSREYCRRTCRELAYRDRRQRRLIDAAVAEAIAAHRPADSSVVETPETVPSVVETERVPAPTVGPGALPTAWRAPVPRRRLSQRYAGPTTPAGRSPILPPPPGVTRESDQP